MPEFITALWPLIDKAGVVGVALGVLLATLIGLDRGWWYTGRDVKSREEQWRERFNQMKVDRDDMKHERDEWRLIALTQRDATQRVATAMEAELQAQPRKDVR